MASHYHILLYYVYTPIQQPDAFAAAHLAWCKSLRLRGRVIVAAEGLNGTVSGSPEACRQYMEALHADPRFSDIDFKVDEADQHAFNRMHVRVKPEIVHSGLRNPAQINPRKQTGLHIDGKSFKQLKEEPDVVVLDVRSNYEHKVGRFKGAVTLDMDNFREFPEKIRELEHLKDKTVITYCTGGIKCEKASALLLQKGFEKVYQLHGGIIKYAKETGGEDFDGVCYVFDQRTTVEVNTVNPAVISQCYVCGTASSRMVNCANPECNVHVPMCPACGQKMDGACSNACMNHHAKRPYEGSGYYAKPPLD